MRVTGVAEYHQFAIIYKSVNKRYCFLKSFCTTNSKHICFFTFSKYIFYMFAGLQRPYISAKLAIM